MEVVIPFAQPHQAREIADASEMLRATHALCSWPAAKPEAVAFFAAAPPWLQRSYAAGGYLTAEDEGSDCGAWEERPGIDFAGLAGAPA